MRDSSLSVILACPNIDAIALHQRIVEGIARRREAATRQGIDFEKLARGDIAPAANASPWDHLWIYQDRICVQPSRIERFSIGVGLLDKLLAWVRGEIHSVVTFYCNRLGERQMLFNRELLQVLKPLTNVPSSIDSLHARLIALEDRVASLECSQDGRFDATAR